MVTVWLVCLDRVTCAAGSPDWPTAQTWPRSPPAGRIAADRQLGTLLGELIVHGRDLARELGRPWPIDRLHVPLVLTGLNQVLPGWVGPQAHGHTATYELWLRGSARYVYAFQDGDLSVGTGAPARADVHISADPAAALLSAYGRIGRWWPALSGRTVVWGRRPWLAARFNDRFLPA